MMHLNDTRNDITLRSSSIVNKNKTIILYYYLLILYIIIILLLCIILLLLFLPNTIPNPFFDLRAVVSKVQVL